MAKIDKDRLELDWTKRNYPGKMYDFEKENIQNPEKMREFETGATRDTAKGKLDFEGFLSPLVLEAFAEYMEENRNTPLGKRDSDNWQKGIDRKVYMKSLFRHFMDVWKEHRGIKTKEGLMKALMGTMFNAMGYAHELLRKEGDVNEKERC